MKANYILVDCENVLPGTLSLLKNQDFQVLLFIGANQHKISVDLASSVHQLGQKAQYIIISGTGPNALDFHIAYYVGRLAEKDPGSRFHIISKDTGFDPLIDYLAKSGITVVRHKAIEELLSNAKLQTAIEHLKKLKGNKPGTEKTLFRAINSFFQNQLTEPALEALVQTLKEHKILQITGNKVEYRLQ